ncbi:transcription elongation factor SPT5-like [Zootermopsis nevadensis]|uniref:transcription elongation factor SPT5-like n=1 Tax=Zootermopsis nevadensis TaxID=136037 RepID=UPI000B8E8AC2|nr:transcription elongation factor SPT5-like [Zootermopsis nevadensis]
MHSWVFFCFALMFLSASVNGFGGADDRYIKKYAMMKVYESCFGSDVVKEVRQEMKAACAKCAGVSATAPGQAVPSLAEPSDKKKPPAGAVPPSFDATRLQQAILSFRSPPQQNPLLSGYIQQSPTVTPQYRPAGFYPQQFPLYYPAVPSGSLYNPQPVPYQSVYPAGPNPYYQAPFYPGAPTYSSGQRASRDLDIRGQLETLTSRLNGKIRNVTCVMQELGYVSFRSFPIPTAQWVQYQKRLGTYGTSHTVFWLALC